MDYAVLGWPADGPQLRLDHERFSYAGKFVMTNTGKAVARESAAADASAKTPADSDETSASSDKKFGSSNKNTENSDKNQEKRDKKPEDSDKTGAIVAAVAFNEDRTDAETLWLRYISVRVDRRGDGIGPRLAAFVTDRARERGYERCRIAVNNAFAYKALYRAGFGFTGEETGVAELLLETDASRDRDTYQAGLDVYRSRDVSAEEADFLAAHEGETPPAVVSPPT